MILAQILFSTDGSNTLTTGTTDHWNEKVWEIKKSQKAKERDRARETESERESERVRKRECEKGRERLRKKKKR
jgi:hypothetical protein